jgi:hypothetical protein
MAGFARRALDAEMSARRAGGSEAVRHLIAAMLATGAARWTRSPSTWG